MLLFGSGCINGECISLSSLGFPLAFDRVTPASHRDSRFPM